MRIRLKHRYRGVLTDIQWIEVGDYDEDDSAIFGLAQYLIDNDHALELNDSGQPVSISQPALPDKPDMTHHNEEMRRAGREEWKPPELDSSDEIADAIIAGHDENVLPDVPTAESEVDALVDQLAEDMMDAKEDYGSYSRDELMSIVEESGIELDRTGKHGRITKQDLLDAL